MPPPLPEEIQRHLDIFVVAAQTVFGADLAAAVLFGSAADGQLRATSDVNLLLLLKRFTPQAADALRAPLRLAHAAIDLQVMFLLESELPQAADAFAVKFADIIARHQVLHGADPFASLHTNRDAVLRRLRQVLLNQQVRMRERYMLLSLNEEQLAGAIADAAGPLRSAAASLAQLEGKPAQSGKQALEAFVDQLGDPALHSALQAMSAARETARLAPGQALPAFTSLMAITERLREHAEQMR
ncbi:nucleotidyltransferase domain-containing protein [Janthinobacterium sp. NKUCC08_JDC]|uniref:nucleotidyltransferase domain-containing protein n=1 Tax=Janthinobacterium sp. NKUCC08_JDC TaxID=2842122 RepID=UPI001C5A7823|nr:nucleotidyltransferase domain-containing protein [Janthinobacterium sp. NKUCC08_JDC]MBW3501721.1 nucleotidyltransferase domain-containing protein [Janthinobacterium sp. NKUCC08_JDC]